tara:strand:- start:425 stop:994 length:570 start_codon:yes stop_codon:yes gene_type:complete
MNVIAIIPAKTDSIRLKKKNLKIINNKSLVQHSIEYALNSKYIKEIYISTESDEVKKIASQFNVSILERNPKLMGKAEVVEVYIDSMTEIKKISKLSKIDIVVGIQPDHPDRQLNIDRAIDYFIENTYDDLFTVDSTGTRNGSIRITKSAHVISGKMSHRVGSLVDNCTNIHDDNDLIMAENNINEKND